ncbi:MAG: hypothetical protein GEV08_11015 [Acidimicrobiia bacterium]|nr:hypothetical protein [Acidimicrobiia bacterium]
MEDDTAPAPRRPREPSLVLARWRGPWADDDPDAAFKAEVAAYGRLDPLETLRGLSAHTGIPVGALALYVLARFATTGSEGLLHLGGATVERMWATCEAAEATATDAARLEAYRTLRGMLSWLRAPLADGSL